MPSQPTFWTIVPTIVSFIILLISIGGYVYASGRAKERFVDNEKKMITKEDLLRHCKKNQNECSGGVSDKIEELKGLVIDLHDKQTKKIEDMDAKRELAKDGNQEEIRKLNKSIGKMEGHLNAMRDGLTRQAQAG